LGQLPDRKNLRVVGSPVGISSSEGRPLFRRERKVADPYVTINYLRKRKHRVDS